MAVDMVRVVMHRIQRLIILSEIFLRKFPDYLKGSVRIHLPFHKGYDQVVSLPLVCLPKLLLCLPHLLIHLLTLAVKGTHEPPAARFLRHGDIVKRLFQVLPCISCAAVPDIEYLADCQSFPPPFPCSPPYMLPILSAASLTVRLSFFI